MFSVIIPVYNRANVISRALDSVLAQTLTDFEIIVVDDGSNDNLKEVYAKYASSKIHYCYQENSGSNPARNNGIKYSSGYYVSFLDSDDAWEPEYLNEVAQKFAGDDEIGFVWVNHIKKYLPDGHIVVKKSRKLEGFVYNEVLQQGSLINSSCITAKRSLIEAIGGWDDKLQACQDDDICFRLTKAAKTGYVDKELCIFYIDERIDRISSSNSRRAWNSLYLWQKHSKDILLFCGKKNFESKIMGVYLRFLESRDRKGLIQCEHILVDLLKMLPIRIFIFRLKCIYGLLVFKVKNNGKYLARRILPGKIS